MFMLATPAFGTSAPGRQKERKESISDKYIIILID